PHERTLAGPREDRYKLLRATGANLSPVVGMYEDRSGRACQLLAEVAEGRLGTAVADVVDGDGTRHRLWVLPADGPTRDATTQLIEFASAGPIAIADGHHRYETALRYRDERRMTRSCEENPAFDYILVLLLETTAEPPMALPTHRVMVGARGDSGSILERAGELFEVDRGVARERLIADFGGALGGGRGRFGVW